jgi:methylated-DNA-[protein]-cysteine S-methyltransferase
MGDLPVALTDIEHEVGMHFYSKVETEIGEFWAAWSPKGVTMICPADKDWKQFENSYLHQFDSRPQRNDIPEGYKHAIQEAAAGRSFDAVSLDISSLSKFQVKVLKNLQKIPRGQVRTYSWLAQRSGHPGAARAVGNTMARNPVPILIPCHRVVPSTGGVGHYGLGSALKRELLLREGVAVEKL